MSWQSHFSNGPVKAERHWELDVMKAETKRVLSDWVLQEVAPWAGVSLTFDIYRRELLKFNEAAAHLVVFIIHDGSVEVMPKLVTQETEKYRVRVELYRDLLTAATSSLEEGLSLFVPICIADHAFDRLPLPVFSFQKLKGDNNILLPDVDFMGWNYYENDDQRDVIKYSDKLNRAAFVGATTGAMIGHQDIDNLAVPRIRAAEYFKGSDLVRFELSEIVQCESDDVIRRLEGMGYGRGRISWQEQLKNKFLISIDGNGATCSRMVMALRSNSVLMKYESDSILYYFRGLKPWQHFIPIMIDAEIPRHVLHEMRHEGSFKNIADEGRAFAEEFICRESVIYYTAELLRNISALVPCCINIEGLI